MAIRNAVLQVRCTEDDHKLVTAAAEVEGLSVTQFALQAMAEKAQRTLKKVLAGDVYYRFPSRRPALQTFLEMMGQAEDEAYAKTHK